MLENIREYFSDLVRSARGVGSAECGQKEFTVLWGKIFIPKFLPRRILGNRGKQGGLLLYEILH